MVFLLTNCDFGKHTLVQDFEIKMFIISILDIFRHLKEELKHTVVLPSCNRSGIILITEKGVTRSPLIATCREHVLDLHE